MFVFNNKMWKISSREINGLIFFLFIFFLLFNHRRQTHDEVFWINFNTVTTKYKKSNDGNDENVLVYFTHKSHKIRVFLCRPYMGATRNHFTERFCIKSENNDESLNPEDDSEPCTVNCVCSLNTRACNKWYAVYFVRQPPYAAATLYYDSRENRTRKP